MRPRVSRRHTTQDQGIGECLNTAAPRPSSGDSREKKKNYAERLSRALAQKIADGLRPHFEGITPDADGMGHETPARTAKGYKKLDVNYSTAELGLALGVSIKTINFPDAGTKRYTKNYSRVENELRAEANDYHHRQPYAVLVAVILMPADCCDDSKRISSFGQAVRFFRHRAGRNQPRTDEDDRFERLFIGLYEHAEPNHGTVAFFDVDDRPPKTGRPSTASTFSFSKVIDAIRSVYDARNNPPFEWA